MYKYFFNSICHEGKQGSSLWLSLLLTSSPDGCRWAASRSGRWLSLQSVCMYCGRRNPPVPAAKQTTTSWSVMLTCKCRAKRRRGSCHCWSWWPVRNWGSSHLPYDMSASDPHACPLCLPSQHEHCRWCRKNSPPQPPSWTAAFLSPDHPATRNTHYKSQTDYPKLLTCSVRPLQFHLEILLRRNLDTPAAFFGRLAMFLIAH